MNYPYICSVCAHALGGKWPKGHVATFHIGLCDNCNNRCSLACWSDWNWPKDKAKDKKAKGERE